MFLFQSLWEEMTSLFSRTATLSCAASNSIPHLSAAKSPSNYRCANLIGPFTESVFLAKKPRKLKPCGIPTFHLFQQKTPLDVCFSHFVVRASLGGGSEYTSDELPPESDNQDDSIEIEIENTGKNSRRIRSKVGIQASLQTVWNILTDYERLADFIPGLAVSKLLEKKDNFVRLFQIGEQNLPFGLKFNAKGTIDCVENDLEILPFGQKRDIDFKMVEGDFQFFEGKWLVEQEFSAQGLHSDCADGLESQTTLVYTVHVKPKVWLPVRLVEGRLCNEIRTNLSCIRKEAERVHQNANSTAVLEN